MSNVKKNGLVLSIIIVLTLISSIWLGFYPIALTIGVFSIIIGIKIFQLASLKFDILGLLCLQIIFLCTAFGLVYVEELGLSFIDSMTLSFQYLFHVSIVSVPDVIENLILFKILASFESFIGYLLIISGVGLMIKSNTNEKKQEEK